MAETNQQPQESDLDRLKKRWSAPWLGRPEAVVEIEDKQLRLVIQSIGTRPDSLNTSSVLSTEYLTLQRKIAEEVINQDEAEVWLPFIQNELELRVQVEKSNIQPINIQFPDRAPAIEQPLHIGAAAEEGRRVMYIVDKGLIDAVDISKDEGRRNFILKNMYAYNYLYLKSSEISTSWLGVIKDWEADINVAQEKTKALNPEQRLDFEKQLRAAMAVTASARAMEISGGSFNDYGISLTGGDRGPNSNWQDKNAKYIIHGDTEKIMILLEDPEIRNFYKKLLLDAGLSGDIEKEIRLYEQLKNGEKIKEEFLLEWNPSNDKPNKVDLLNPFYNRANGKDLFIKQLIEKSPLIQYLRDSAEKGGLDGYIDNILLKGLDEKSADYKTKKAAAKLACDIFLVDKWTRWEELMPADDPNEPDKPKKLNLQPSEEWAGDPLKAVLKPTFLPRLKGVYSGPDEVVLDAIDLAFRPKDIYMHMSDESMAIAKRPLGPKVRLVVPSMVTNLKTLIRYNAALDKFLGGPMGANIPNWSSQVMGDLTGGGGTFDLIDQVYGAQQYNVPNKNGGERPYSVGKHIDGAIAMRLLYAKALAVTLESDKPGFAQQLQVLFDAGNKMRPNLEILTLLLGPNRDGTRGLLKTLQGGRLDFVLGKSNAFDANYDYIEMMKILESDDQTGKSNTTSVNIAGFALDSSAAIANALGMIGSRK